MLYYKQAFGNVFDRGIGDVFDRGKSKCCGVLFKHHGKVKSEQVITLQMAQQLKTQNISVVTGQLFCLNFCQRQANCIDDPDKVQSVTDTENEFTECQTPRKKLQPIGISPVSLHAFMKTLKSNISEA